jgi:hypothetical protein
MSVRANSKLDLPNYAAIIMCRVCPLKFYGSSDASFFIFSFLQLATSSQMCKFWQATIDLSKCKKKFKDAFQRRKVATCGTKIFFFAAFSRPFDRFFQHQGSSEEIYIPGKVMKFQRHAF